jgi:hypothetical protein
MNFSMTGNIIERRNDGATFEARFWLDFYRAMLTRAKKKALGKWFSLGLIVLLVAGALRGDDWRFNLVVLIDLSASVVSKGPDGKTDFEKNVTAVTDLIAHTPAGTQLTVLGITGISFAEPDILLRADVPVDSGYFGERLTSAHRQIMQAWQHRAGQLAPTAKETDILGALAVASQIFDETHRGSRKVLVIYSDMRQATPELNLEHSVRLSNKELRYAAQSMRSQNLQGAEIDVLGADASGKDAEQWESLKQFWSDYFEQLHAELKCYSVLRQPPPL